MVQHGLMTQGATKLVTKEKAVGMMSVGGQNKLTDEEKEKRAEEKVKDEKEKLKKEKIELKKVEDTLEKKEKEKVDLDILHVQTLKKMALEKGYEGEAFDRETLIKFLEINSTEA